MSKIEFKRTEGFRHYHPYHCGKTLGFGGNGNEILFFVCLVCGERFNREETIELVLKTNVEMKERDSGPRPTIDDARTLPSDQLPGYRGT